MIEPGLGYLVPVLREKFKQSRIIALHVDSSFPQIGVPAWRCTDTLSVQDFLERELPETDASRIRIIEWRPSLNYYGEAYLNLLSQVVEFIKRVDAGQRTTNAFGRRWVRNFFKNVGNLQKAVLYRETEIPVIVTGSGPGLETAIPVIRQLQESCLVMAASSSITALERGGITADIAVATDGGAWALQHIYPYFRGSERALAFASSLFAALPSQCGSIPNLVMNDGSFWQSIVLHELGIPSVIIPQKGTVAASAVELALLLSSGNIYLAGMDFSVRDIRTHARPYGFDHLSWGSASRFSPVYSQSFIRSGLIQKGGSYGVYASWFKNRLSAWPKRIFTLGNNHTIFENTGSPKPAGKKDKSDYFKAVQLDNDPAAFRKKGAASLLKAMETPGYAAKVKAELTPLLFPGENEVPDRELRRAIEETAEGAAYQRCKVSDG